MLLNTSINSLNDIPERIISLVPSQTELLYHLDLDHKTVGITKFCIHPANWFKTKTRVGGTKSLHIETIRKLKPDLIIANKEENVKEQIETLAIDYPVWVTDIVDLNSAQKMILDLGKITATEKSAKKIVDDIHTGFLSIKKINPPLNCCYLIWQNPYITVGGDTFIHAMLEVCGFNNIYQLESRYPSILLEDLKKHQLDILMLSSEPYPFKQKHLMEIKKILPDTRIILVDGEMFSWYGSRLLKASNYFNSLIQERCH